VRTPPKAKVELAVIKPSNMAEPTISSTKPSGYCRVRQVALGNDLTIVFQDDQLLVLTKPSGLAAQGGSKLKDNVALRLASACTGDGVYVPAPAHRLDKAASGLLLAGKTHAMQSYLHTLLRNSTKDLKRDYLCWVQGDFLFFAQQFKNAGERFSELEIRSLLISDYLQASVDEGGRECMRVCSPDNEYSETALGKLGSINDKKQAKKVLAEALFSFVEKRQHPRFGINSLIKVRLLTGRKHQIRVQLATRGFPIIGDVRYKGPAYKQLLLHAAHIRIPAIRTQGLDFSEKAFFCVPLWTGFFSLTPDALS
jgi:23S rRNA pseudouridine955/2504/2580 synthase